MLKTIAERFESLVADVVLNLACVIFGNFRINTQCDEIVSKLLVTGIDLVCDLQTLLCYGDKPGTVHLNIAFFTETLHCITYTGLCNTEKFRNINRTDITVLLLENEHGFEIIFS